MLQTNYAISFHRGSQQTPQPHDNQLVGRHLVLCEYAIAAFFAYFGKVRTSHIFPHKLVFLTANCVSVTYFY